MIQEEYAMSETKERNTRTPAGGKFYGALKSGNELYFQMASVFRAASRGESGRAAGLMHRILVANHPERAGNLFPNGI